MQFSLDINPSSGGLRRARGQSDRLVLWGTLLGPTWCCGEPFLSCRKIFAVRIWGTTRPRSRVSSCTAGRGRADRAIARLCSFHPRQSVYFRPSAVLRAQLHRSILSTGW